MRNKHYDNIVHNAQKEIEKLEPYNKFKMGEVYIHDNLFYVYLCPSLSDYGWGIFHRLDKKLRLYGSQTRIPFILIKKTEHVLNVEKLDFRKYSIEGKELNIYV